MARFATLDEADHRRVTDAVGRAEAVTDGEIVTVVAARSDGYDDIASYWAIGICFAILALVAILPGAIPTMFAWATGGWDHALGMAEILPILFFLLVACFVSATLILRYLPLRLALTPRSIRARRVRQRAIDYFRIGAERRTTRRVGILIYLSVAEHMAEIVADEAIAAVVPPERWGDTMAAMIDLVRAGRPGEGLAAAVTGVGTILAEHFPKSEGDVNELPDRLIEL